MEDRRNGYKMIVVAEEARRRRAEENSKNKKEEKLLKKRQVVPSSYQPPFMSSTTAGAPPHVDQTSKIKFESLPCMVAGIYSNDSKMQLEATTQLRKLLSSTGSPPIEEVIQYGVVPRFGKFLMRGDFPQLQFEAVWALTNIAIAISDHVAVPFILKLLAFRSDVDLREQRKPAVFAALERILVLSNDEKVLTNTCWALSYLYSDDKIQAVIKSGVCQRLVELLQHSSPSVVIPALRTVGNIVTGDNDVKIQVVIEAGLIAPLVNLLKTAEFDIKKEAACAISNTTSGGNIEQIKYLVNQECIKPLCDLLSCPDPRIVTVCLQGLENILKGHDNDEIYEKAIKILETYYTAWKW